MTDIILVKTVTGISSLDLREYRVEHRYNATLHEVDGKILHPETKPPAGALVVEIPAVFIVSKQTGKTYQFFHGSRAREFIGSLGGILPTINVDPTKDEGEE